MSVPPESLPGPEIDPTPAPEETPASPSPDMPWPPQPAETPAVPPAEAPAPAPAPVEMPSSPPVQPPGLPTQTPITGRAFSVARPSRALAGWILAFGAAVAPSFAGAAVDAADRRFMSEATATGMVEIVLGRIAQEKAAGEPARRLGLQMVGDHIKANEALKAMAAAKDVALPTGLTAQEKAGASRFKKIKGAGFDRQYIAKMVADHQKAVALFSRASTSASDADVKAFAVAQLPTMQSHLDMAKQAAAVPAATPKRGTAARE